ncbi:phosphotransferase [Actinoplanes sp. HUAS TT8]|uniref:phosphotransferase n=1 Tax=Actinoplanes sp. HUAS TT8 TaxID=3447453 RepID=UPI003F526C21
MGNSRVPPLAPEVQVAVAAAFGLGRVVACQPVQTGVMNLNWQLSTDRGVFAVKRLTDRSPEVVRAGQTLLPRLAGRGFPVAAPWTTADGDSILRIGDFAYAVNDWILGRHPNGDDLDAEALGDLVGRLHVELADLCPAAPGRMRDSPATVDRARAELARFAARAAESRDDFDRFAGREIPRRLDLLRTIADRRPPEADLAPCGWTHGDLNRLNLLIGDDGRINGLLDWDRLDVRPYGREVVRTATILFGDDLERIAGFVRGYRERVPITDEQLADAAERRWWELATETWPLKRHYDAGDTSCDHLFTTRGAYLYWWTDHRREVRAAITPRRRSTGSKSSGVAR